MSADDYAVCVRPDELSYAELRAQRDELLAALARAEIRIAWHEGSTPLQQELLALCNKHRAAIARCKETPDD